MIIHLLYMLAHTIASLNNYDLLSYHYDVTKTIKNSLPRVHGRVHSNKTLYDVVSSKISKDTCYKMRIM